MNSTQSNNKKQAKKFNLIYFIDSNKTYHYKINLIFVKILITFFILLNITSAILIFISYSIIKNSNNQERYIINFKKSLLNYYLEKSYLKEDKKKDHENSSTLANNENKSVENLKKQEITSASSPEAKPHEKPANIIAESKPQDKTTSSTAETAPKDNETNIKNEKKPNIIEDSGIKIENPKIIQEETSAKIYFSLLNTSSTTKTISGSICLVIIGVSSQGENKIYKIPAKLEVNKENTPFSCNIGEHVKFSRLRLSEFTLNVNKKDFQIKKVNVYFSNKRQPGIVINSF